MLINIILVISSIENSNFQTSNNDSLISDYGIEKLKIFIDVEDCIFISDENSLELVKDKNTSNPSISKAQFYYIKPKDQGDKNKIQNFIKDLKSSSKINWEIHDDIEIQWQIFEWPGDKNIHEFPFLGTIYYKIMFGEKQIARVEPDIPNYLHYRVFQLFEIGPSCNEEEIENKQNFYDLIKIIDLQPKDKNFSKIVILKKSLLQNEKLNFCTSRGKQETPKQNILLKYGFIILFFV